MKVAFIGLGSMGTFMARRLARVGHEVTGCDVSPANLAAFDEPGTRQEADPVSAARGAEVVGVCVRTDGQLEALCGDGALFEALGEGGIVVVHSTVAPDLARRLAELAARHGVGLVDAGISPGGPYVGEGRASVFVGGDADTVERARPYLEALGKVAHLGPVGRGLEGKLLNNLASVAAYGLSAAVLDLAADLGFDPMTLRDALLGGSAQSFALQVAPGLLRPEGAADLHDLLKKDVDHAMDLAGEDNAHARVLRAAAEAMLGTLRERAKQA